MKKLVTVLLIISLMVFMTLPALAAGTIGKYTPVFDGDKDEAYDKSLKFNLYANQDLDAGEAMYCDGGDDINAADANTWILYDDEYLYVFAEIKDNDLVDIGMDAFKEETNPWQSDACELWFSFDEDNETWIKFSTIAYGLGTWGQEGFDFVMSGDEPAQNGYDAIVKMNPDGYTAEYKIPIKKYGIKEGSQIYYALQINNLRSDGSLIISGRQLQNSGDIDNAAILTLGGEIIIEVPAEPEPEEPAPANETPQDVVVSVPAPAQSPQTGDMSVLLIFAMLGLVAIGIKTGKKKI
ncbi:MAG: hypothetical protein FWF92_07120 [Oscillospiraceae bacterium]|nr:hypothetical protein [Oscillospiraceae bacterium]